MLFNQKKYLGLLTALFLLTLAFVLMNGPKHEAANEFDESIFSFRRITLAPLLLIGTYIGLIILILKRPKKICSEEKRK